MRLRFLLVGAVAAAAMAAAPAALASGRNPQTGAPASLDRIVFKWYGDPDAMIAGFRGGEADVMFGLAESDLAKVTDLGDAGQII